MSFKYKLGIISPTYNEVANIPILVERIKQNVEKAKIKTILVVVDDGSPDGTGDAVTAISSQVQSEYLTVELLQRGAKLGFASAYLDGIRKLQSDVEFVMTMDADLSHQQKYIPDFLTKAESQNLDVVNGSRYMQGGGIQNWGWHRIILSRWAAFYCGVMLWSNLSDFSSGYNLYRTSFLKNFDLNQIKAAGFFFLIEMRYKLIKAGAKVGEVPIVFCDREFGQPKMSIKYMIENAVGVIKLRFGK
jgi:dolichol-phosphate mannosyltransferase